MRKKSCDELKEDEVARKTVREKLKKAA